MLARSYLPVCFLLSYLLISALALSFPETPSSSFPRLSDPLPQQDPARTGARGSRPPDRAHYAPQPPYPDASSSFRRSEKSRRRLSSKQSSTSLLSAKDFKDSPTADEITDLGSSSTSTSTSASNSNHNTHNTDDRDPNQSSPICDLLIEPPLFSPPDTRTQPGIVALVVGIITIVTASLMM
ncbi:hypothetical protein BZA70DRAFT_312611 [Myxozyma melibiosi]|uniref:Uncharacterized protein n=1 Tax=Myxozyma melibiosi TaxID=54550 RepID=A0ABR1F1Z4_9ASCO